MSRRKDPPLTRRHEVTVSMTDREFGLIQAAASDRHEPVGAWLRSLGVAVARDRQVRPSRKENGRGATRTF